MLLHFQNGGGYFGDWQNSGVVGECNIRNAFALPLLDAISEHLHATYLPENCRRNIFRKG
jgi:hypothetical protein